MISSFNERARTIIFMVHTVVFLASCATIDKGSGTVQKQPDILYIYPDGTMEFKDRIMNEDEVVIYKDGFGGERAAVLLRIPYKEDIFRDTITVERKKVPIKRVE